MLHRYAPIAKGVNRVIETNAPAQSQSFDIFGETHPESFVGIPVYRTVNETNDASDIVAMISSTLPWQRYFLGLLPEVCCLFKVLRSLHPFIIAHTITAQGIKPIILVVSNKCDQAFSFRIDGPSVTYLGNEDIHETKFDPIKVSTQFSPFPDFECTHTLDLYPSSEFKNEYETSQPIIYTAAVVGMFLVTVMVFFLYDVLVQRRQRMVANKAARSAAVVSSLFPTRVAQRLIDDAKISADKKKQSTKPLMLGNAAVRADVHGLEATADRGGRLPGFDDGPGGKPIAELFPTASVFFADIGMLYLIYLLLTSQR